MTHYAELYIERKSEWHNRRW